MYDGASIVLELEKDGDDYLLGKEHVRGLSLGGGIGGLLYTRDADGTTGYFHYDGRGNAVSVTNEAQEEIAYYEYDAWGNILTACGSLANEFAFSTKQASLGTGLVDFGYRHYDPSVGRWTQRDPIGAAGGTDVYSAFGDDPIDYSDTWGEKLVLKGKAAAVDAFVERLQNLTGSTVELGSDGEVSLKKGDTLDVCQSLMYGLLNKLVEAKEPLEMAVVSGEDGKGILYDNFDTKTVDEGDLQQLDKNAPASWGERGGPTSGEIVAHILGEYHHALTQADTFGPCHQKGIEAQNRYRKKASGNDPLCAITGRGAVMHGRVSWIGYSNDLVFVTTGKANGDLMFWEPMTKTEFVKYMRQAGIRVQGEGDL